MVAARDRVNTAQHSTAAHQIKRDGQGKEENYKKAPSFPS
jgi:hypothetical protein